MVVTVEVEIYDLFDGFIIFISIKINVNGT